MQYIFFVILAALLICVLVHKIKYGSASCCGEREAAEDKVDVSDKDIRHYPFCYDLSIDGMVCVNCVRKVENLFNLTGEMLSKASLEKKGAQLFCKRRLERREVAAMLSKAGYTLTDFKEENHEIK